MTAHSAIHDAEAIERLVAALPVPDVAPRGDLWVAWEEEVALGCLALRELTPATAELKRMYARQGPRASSVRDTRVSCPLTATSLDRLRE
jgi:hypothetical protein